MSSEMPENFASAHDQSPILSDYAAEREPTTLTRRIANALRTQRIDALGQLAPAAGCIAPILMGMRLDKRFADFIETLPYDGQRYELAELRNALCGLGIRSRGHPHNGQALDDDALPSLIERNDGKLFVAIKRTDAGYMVYDAQECVYHLDVSLPDRGTRYSFADISGECAERLDVSENWWTKLWHRFRRLFGVIVLMTLVINLIAAAPPLFVMMVYDQAISGNSPDTLLYLTVGIVFLLIAEFGLRTWRANALGWLAARLDILVSVEIFRHLMRLPPMTSERTTLWSQLGLARQFDGIRDLISGSSASLLFDISFIPIAIVIVALMAGPLALVPAALLVLQLCVILIFVRPLPIEDTVGRPSLALRNTLTLEILSLVRDIRRLGVRDIWQNRFRSIDAAALSSKLAQSKRQIRIEGLCGFFGSAAGVAALGWGSLMVIDGAMSIGALIATMIVMWRIVGPLQGLLALAPRWLPARESFRQIDRLMHVPAEKTKESAHRLHPNFRGAIELRSVSFRYSADSPPALVGLSAQIRPGELVAVTGSSGSGKSTLLKLLCGVYPPQGGIISFDGVNIHQINATALRKTISYFPRDPNLFSGTVADNIRYSYPGATDKQLCELAEEVGILQDIEALECGFDTVVGGEQTSAACSSLTFSINLARTLARECPIILLDEPGANIDHETDDLLMQCLARRQGRQTILLVTHRPSHIKLADQVIDLGHPSLVPS